MVSDEMETSVLIAGGGPAGLMAAAALARDGIEALLVERRPRPSQLPRATVVSTRSMELLRSLGLEEDTRAGGVDVEPEGWVGETLASPEGVAVPLGLPTREQSAVLSPTAPACVPQDHLEPVLLRHVRSSATVQVALGTELELLANGPGGVRAALRDAGTGASRVVDARYLVAADGARSAVRAALGIPLIGPDDLERAVSALFRAPLWELLGDRRFGLYDVNHPEARGVLLPAGPGDRWIYGTLDDLGPGDATAAMARRIRLAAGATDLEPRIERVGTFAFAAQVAARFREGSVFLAGDAAHRVTPRGGTGMNTALHDGWDLGWKLAWVLRGWAEPGLLDTYEAERRPVAEHNAARSADREGSAAGAGQAVQADLGGRIPHAWVPSAAGRASTLDLLGPGLTLFTGPDRAAWEAAADFVDRLPPLVVRSLDAISARALGIRPGGALLVRPDGAPAGWWPDASDAAPSLGAAFASARGGRAEALALT
jgi:putative polyketide hydroxylase